MLEQPVPRPRFGFGLRTGQLAHGREGLVQVLEQHQVAMHRGPFLQPLPEQHHPDDRVAGFKHVQHVRCFHQVHVSPCKVQIVLLQIQQVQSPQQRTAGA